MSESPQIEVRCPECNVSFPVGTRRCLHCGGATVEPEIATQIRAIRSGSVILAPEPVDETTMAEEVEEAGGRRGPRSLTLLWILLAVAASIYRSCATPG